MRASKNNRLELNSFAIIRQKSQSGFFLSRKRVWVRCVTRTRTRVGKPALGFYESLKKYIWQQNKHGKGTETIRYKD